MWLLLAVALAAEPGAGLTEDLPDRSGLWLGGGLGWTPHSQGDAQLAVGASAAYRPFHYVSLDASVLPGTATLGDAVIVGDIKPRIVTIWSADPDKGHGLELSMLVGGGVANRQLALDLGAALDVYFNRDMALQIDARHLWTRDGTGEPARGWVPGVSLQFRL